MSIFTLLHLVAITVKIIVVTFRMSDKVDKLIKTWKNAAYNKAEAAFGSRLDEFNKDCLMVAATAVEANKNLLNRLIPDKSKTFSNDELDYFFKYCLQYKSSLLAAQAEVDEHEVFYSNNCPVNFSLLNYVTHSSSAWSFPSPATLVKMSTDSVVTNFDMDNCAMFDLVLGDSSQDHFIIACNFLQGHLAQDQREIGPFPGQATVVETFPITKQAVHVISNQLSKSPLSSESSVLLHRFEDVGNDCCGFPSQIFIGNGFTWMLRVSFNIWRNDNEVFLGRSDLQGIDTKDLKKLFKRCIFMKADDRLALERGINLVFGSQLSAPFVLEDSTCIDHLLLLAGTDVTTFDPPSISVQLFGSVSGMFSSPDPLWLRSSSSTDALLPSYGRLGMDHVRYTKNASVVILSSVLNSRFCDPDVWCALLKTFQPVAMYGLCDFLITAVEGQTIVDHVWRRSVRNPSPPSLLSALSSVISDGVDHQVSGCPAQYNKLSQLVFSRFVPPVHLGGPKYLILERAYALRQYTMFSQAAYSFPHVVGLCSISSTVPVKGDYLYGYDDFEPQQLPDDPDRFGFGPTVHPLQSIITLKITGNDDKSLITPTIPIGRTFEDAVLEFARLNWDLIPVLFNKLAALSEQGFELTAWRDVYVPVKQIFRHMCPGSVCPSVPVFENQLNESWQNMFGAVSQIIDGQSGDHPSDEETAGKSVKLKERSRDSRPTSRPRSRSPRCRSRSRNFRSRSRNFRSRSSSRDLRCRSRSRLCRSRSRSRDYRYRARSRSGDYRSRSRNRRSCSRAPRSRSRGCRSGNDRSMSQNSRSMSQNSRSMSQNSRFMPRESRSQSRNHRSPSRASSRGRWQPNNHSKSDAMSYGGWRGRGCGPRRNLGNRDFRTGRDFFLKQCRADTDLYKNKTGSVQERLRATVGHVTKRSSAYQVAVSTFKHADVADDIVEKTKSIRFASPSKEGETQEPEVQQEKQKVPKKKSGLKARFNVKSKKKKIA